MMKKCCPHQGCKEIIDISAPACSKHISFYDTHIRRGTENKQYDEFYHSTEWLITHDVILTAYLGMDVYAYYAHKEILPAFLVHHIVEIKDDWSKRLLKSNLIPISDASHREIGVLYREDKASAQAMLFDYLKRFRAEYCIILQ